MSPKLFAEDVSKIGPRWVYPQLYATQKLTCRLLQHRPWIGRAILPATDTSFCESYALVEHRVALEVHEPSSRRTAGISQKNGLGVPCTEGPQKGPFSLKVLRRPRNGHDEYNIAPPSALVARCRCGPSALDVKATILRRDVRLSRFRRKAGEVVREYSAHP